MQRSRRWRASWVAALTPWYSGISRNSDEIIITEEDVSPEKADQIEVSGGTLHRVPGGRSAATAAALDALLDAAPDAAFTAARDDAQDDTRDDTRDTYYASHCWNPYFFHGTKTFAFEVCEQLGWAGPDVVVLPVGNGTLVLGAFIGFQDLLHADMIDQLPRIVGVQAEQCCPLFNEFHDTVGGRNAEEGWREDMQGRNGGIERQPRERRSKGGGNTDGICRKTVAEGIAIPHPIRGPQILEAIRESGGTILKVTEEEIIHALRWAIERRVIIEPTSAATVAGVEQYLGNHEPDLDEIIVSTYTGHGSNSAGKLGRLLE